MRKIRFPPALLVIAATLAALPPLAACSPLLEMAGNSAGLPSESKLVEGKIPPDILVARDGSRCRVPVARFDAIKPGQHITCVWTRGSVDVR